MTGDGRACLRRPLEFYPNRCFSGGFGNEDPDSATQLESETDLDFFWWLRDGGQLLEQHLDQRLNSLKRFVPGFRYGVVFR